MYIFILIFILIIIIAYLYGANTGGGAEPLKLKLPIISMKKIQPEFIEYARPDICIGARAYLGYELPIAEGYNFNLLDIILSPYKFNYTVMRLYAEIFTALNFLNICETAPNLVIIESRYGIVSQIISYLKPNIKIHLFTIKPFYKLGFEYNNIKIYNKYPDTNDFKKMGKNILINFSIFGSDKYSYRLTQNAIINEYNYAKYLYEGFKPVDSIHILKAFNKNIDIEMPAHKLYLVPFSGFGLIHNYAVRIAKAYTKGPTSINLYKILNRLIYFDLCIRNQNHGYEKYEVWDTYIAKKLLKEFKFDFSIIGPIPDIPNENPLYYLCSNKLSYTDKNIFLSGTVENKLFKHSPLTHNKIEIAEINEFAVHNGIMNFNSFEIAFTGINNIAFFMELIDELFILNAKYIGTIYCLFQAPVYKHMYYFDIIQVKSRDEAEKLASKAGKKIYNLREKELAINVYNFLKKGKFPQYNRIWIKGHICNIPLIYAINKLYPNTTINIIGKLLSEEIFTINYDIAPAYYTGDLAVV